MCISATRRYVQNWSIKSTLSGGDVVMFVNILILLKQKLFSNNLIKIGIVKFFKKYFCFFCLIISHNVLFVIQPKHSQCFNPPSQHRPAVLGSSVSARIRRTAPATRRLHIRHPSTARSSAQWCCHAAAFRSRLAVGRIRCSDRSASASFVPAGTPPSASAHGISLSRRDKLLVIWRFPARSKLAQFLRPRAASR